MSEWVHPLPGKRKQSVKNRAGTKESLALSGFTLTLAPRVHQPGPVQDPGPDQARHCLTKGSDSKEVWNHTEQTSHSSSPVADPALSARILSP